MINLSKPIVFFDIESTGLHIIQDRIIEISLLKVYPDGKEEIKNYLLHPGMPIPKEAMAIHGITDERVKDCPPFSAVAQEIADFIGQSDLGGFNLLKFDVPMLLEEFIRNGIDFDIDNRDIIDVQGIYHRMEQRNLSAAVKFYCDKDLENAHSAEADTIATFEVFKAQVARYDVLPDTIKDMAAFIGNGKRVDLEGRIVYNDKGEEVFNFGKHKGRKVEDVFLNEPSYYNWMLDGEFSGYTKKVIQKIKLRMLQNKFSGK